MPALPTRLDPRSPAFAANAARMPTLDASGSVSRSRLARDQDPQGQGGAYSTLRSLSVDFNYNFDLWGGQRAAWEAALGQARAAGAARHAAGAVVRATELVVSGQVERAFCNVRPPGHHATRDAAMGFCFFTNVCIGARRALERQQHVRRLDLRAPAMRALDVERRGRGGLLGRVRGFFALCERLGPRACQMVQKVQRWSQPVCTATKLRTRA